MAGSISPPNPVKARGLSSLWGPGPALGIAQNPGRNALAPLPYNPLEASTQDKPRGFPPAPQHLWMVEGGDTCTGKGWKAGPVRNRAGKEERVGWECPRPHNPVQLPLNPVRFC